MTTALVCYLPSKTLFDVIGKHHFYEYVGTSFARSMPTSAASACHPFLVFRRPLFSQCYLRRRSKHGNEWQHERNSWNGLGKQRPAGSFAMRKTSAVSPSAEL